MDPGDCALPRRGRDSHHRQTSRPVSREDKARMFQSKESAILFVILLASRPAFASTTC